MDLDELTVMQDTLRHVTIDTMIVFVKKGGFWTAGALNEYAVEHEIRPCPIIELARFPDDRFMIHNGHHRVVATYLAGRYYLRPDEFFVKNWRYEDYMSINFEQNYVTPFDPRIECRRADIAGFKKNVNELLQNSGEEEARKYILGNKRMYSTPRIFSGVNCLANRYLDRSAVFVRG